MATTQNISAIAAIVAADRRAADVLLAEFATTLKQSGYQVYGLLQWRPPDGKSGTVLIDLHDDKRYPLFQNLGAGSEACSVDTGSLANASQALRHALDARADLAIANRFGPLEAAGGGLASEMLALMAEEIPFLTIVAEEHLPTWRHFTGNAAIELAAEKLALENWFSAIR